MCSIMNGGKSASITAIIMAAAVKLDGMIAEGDIKYDEYVMSMSGSKSINMFKAQTSRAKFMFWEAFPKLTSKEYGGVYAMLKVKLGLTHGSSPSPANRVVFNKALHGKMRVP